MSVSTSSAESSDLIPRSSSNQSYGAESDVSENMQNGNDVVSPKGNCQSTSQDGFKVYKKRWILLLIVFMLNYTNASMWICFAPVADTTASYYNVSLFQVNLLTAIFFLMFIPFNFVGTFIAERYGLKTLMITASLVNMLGGFIRICSVFFFHHDNDLDTDNDGSSVQYYIVFLGQMVAAVAQALIMIQPAKLAAYWFAPSERTIANAGGTIANEIGLMVALLATPFIVDHKDVGVEHMIYVWSAPSAIPLLLCSVFFFTSSYPPLPPSPSAATESMGFKDSIKDALTTKQFWVLMLSFGTGIAAFSTLVSLLEQILCVNGYSDTFSGIASTACIGCGCVGAAIFGSLADYTKLYELIYKVCYLVACLGVCAFAWASTKSDNEVAVLITVGWFGFFGLVLFPLALELGVECTYPSSEAASSGFAILAGQPLGMIMVIGLPLLGQPLSDRQESLEVCANGIEPSDLWISMLVMAALLCSIAIFTAFCFHSPDKRLKAERFHLTQGSQETLDFNNLTPNVT